MKRRLYFLVPEVSVAKDTVADLLLNHVPERDIHIVAKDHQLLKQEELPEATVLQEKDVVPAMQKGVAMGGATGLLAGLIAVAIPGIGLALGGGAILATTVAGAGFGAFVGPMLGISANSSRLEQFEQAIDAGQLLMLIDIAKERVDDIRAIVARHHPQVQIEGMEPTVPPFP